MGNEISEILRYSRGWGKIGIDTCICRVEKIIGIRKLHRFSIKITNEIHQRSEKIPEGSNFFRSNSQRITYYVSRYRE